jgi:alcohol dehydrogenase
MQALSCLFRVKLADHPPGEPPIMDLDTSTPFTFPGRLLVGPGALAQLPRLLPGQGRAILVCDRGLADLGIAGRVAATLNDPVIFSEIDPDPEIPCVERALGLARAEDCRQVIGLGGGSALDAAKALAIRLAWPLSLREIGDGLALPGPIAPLTAIPSTAGTGSEATRVAVISDPATREKMALRGEELVPALAILDPELLASLPRNIAAECGADALTHAMEAYLSRQAGHMTDALALAAVSIIAEALPRHVANPGDLAAGERMLVASHLAGRAFTHAGLGLVHSLAEPLGAFHHLRHGLACALFLPVVLAFNAPASPERMARMAGAMGTVDAVSAVRELLLSLGLPDSYEAAGIDFTPHPEMLAQVPPQFSTRCNPRRATAEEIASLFDALRD